MKKLLGRSQVLDGTQPTVFSVPRGIFWKASTRILAIYAISILAFVGTSIPIFQQILFRSVDERVEEDLQEDFESFVEYFDAWQAEVEPNADNLKASIDEFLSLFRLEDDNFLIFWVDSQFYRSEPTALPEVLASRLDSLTASDDGLTNTQQGILPNPDCELGDILYLVGPLIADGQQQGVVIAAHTVAGERTEALASVQVFIGMSIGTVAFALIMAWIATGYVLQPVQQLALAARNIRESNLTQRVPVTGSGEMAYLSQAFNHMLNRLQETFEAQREFIRDASHEMRTPITIVRGHLELLDDPSPEQQETLDLAIDELDRMSRFVSDLMVLARSELPDFLQLAPFELGSFTDDVLEKVRMLGDRDWQLEARADGTLEGDRQRITEALLNLAHNAVVHTQPGDEIALGTQVLDGFARFWIRDTGAGIAPEDRERIFRRFARGKTERKSSGSGLGLAIAKAILEAHGGWMELSSQVGIGSKFVLVIPYPSVVSQ